MDGPGLPGCALSVMREGEVVYEHGYGMANLEYGIPIAPHSVFHVASVSKQFTAFSIAMLEAEGKLSLDDDVRKYVPEVPDHGAPITIRHLIHHISGIRDQWDLLAMSGWRWEADVVTQKDVLEVVSLQRGLNFEPGDEYLYSNTGYTLLAVIVERVSGQSLREFTSARIFEPLGMTATHFHDDHETIVINRAYAYAPDRSPGAAAGGFDGGLEQSIPDFDVVGASSLFTTVEDLARWDANFYSGKVGGTELIERLHTRGVLNGGAEIPYAFALAHGTHNGLATVGHGGADAGYRSNFLRYPEKELSVAVLCNFSASNPGGLARQVGEVYLGDQMVEADGNDNADVDEIEVSEVELQSYAGMYWNSKTDRVARLAMRQGQLYQITNQRRRLLPVAPGQFVVEGGGRLMIFENRGPDGGIVLKVPADADDPQILQRVPAADLDAAGLASYAGRYRSEELGTDYIVVVENRGLVIKHRKLDDRRLRPTYVDGFNAGGRVLRFTRDDAGEIDGFRLSTGRVWGVRFDRVALPIR